MGNGKGSEKKHKKRRSEATEGQRSPQPRKSRKSVQKELPQSTSGDRETTPEGPDVESVEVPPAFEVGNSEFDAAFDLEAIPLALRERMVAAAPMLLGRNAEYDNMFFHDKVGLCDRGPTVDDVSKVYPHILESNIKKVWRPGSQLNRFEIANCLDKEQAQLFSQHNYRVYGNCPDNAYFAMRFLKAAYATFVHGLDVNWVAEATVRRSKRFATALKNPKKLGPVALRRQVEGLCELMASVASGTPERQIMPRSADRALTEVVAARATATLAQTALETLQRDQNSALGIVNAFTDAEYSRLELECNAANTKLSRLFREGTATE